MYASMAPKELSYLHLCETSQLTSQNKACIIVIFFLSFKSKILFNLPTAAAYDLSGHFSIKPRICIILYERT